MQNPSRQPIDQLPYMYVFMYACIYVCDKGGALGCLSLEVKTIARICNRKR